MKKHTKMRKYIFAVFVCVSALLSCMKEQEQWESLTDEMIFEASLDPAGSKAVLRPGTGRASVEWVKGDMVNVFASSRSYVYKANQAGASCTLKADGQGAPSGATYYGLLPYNASATQSDANITTTLPATQTAVKSSFSTHLAVASTTNDKMQFKNVCALVKVNLTANNITKIVFEGNSGEIVAGDINIAVTTAPSWTAADEGTSTTVTLKPASGSTLATGDYYFTVLPQTFEKGFKITAYKGDAVGAVREVTDKVTLPRAGIISPDSYGINGSGTQQDPYILMTGQDVKDMRTLAKENSTTWFEMGADIDMKDVKNYVPVNYDNNFTRQVHFDGAGFSLDNFSCDFTTYPSLFGVLYGSCKDLKVTNAKVTGTTATGIIGGYVGTNGKAATLSGVSVQGTVSSTADRVGGFGGCVVGATFTNCTANVTVSSAKSDVGAFAGKIQGECSFTDCSAKANISSTYASKQRQGGFAGWVNGTTVTFTRCKVLTGSVLADNSGNTAATLQMNGGFIAYAGSSVKTVMNHCSVDVTMDMPMAQTVGGAVGIVGSGTFSASNCSVKGSVTANNQVGGFVAYQESSAIVNISSSNSAATVTGTGHYIAGFAGRMVNVSGKALVLTDCYATGNVTSNNSSCSAFLGCVDSDVTLTRCYATGSISGNRNIGGLVGYISGGVTKMTQCYYAGPSVTGTTTIGGLIGHCVFDNSSTIQQCYSKTTVSGTGNVGGLVANLTQGGNLTASYAESTIVNTGDNTGGLVGTSAGNVVMNDCYYAGSLSGKTRTGGLIGYTTSGTGNFSKCRSRGTVTSTSSARYSGGLIGQTTGAITIEQSWSSANVTAEQFAGGLVGWATGTSIAIRQSYASGAVKSNRGSGGIVARTDIPATIDKCIAWNPQVSNARTLNTNYSSGAIVGSAKVAGTFTSCYRRSDMDFVDGYISLVNHNDVTNALPPAPTMGEVDGNQYAYHGKAAAANATLSSVAASLGWTSSVYTDGEFVSGDVWTHTVISEGLTLHEFNGMDKSSGTYVGTNVNQIVQVLDVDLKNPRYGLKYYYHGEPNTAPTVIHSEAVQLCKAQGYKVVAGVNGGYEPTSTFVQADGVTYYSSLSEKVQSSGMPQWKNDAGFYFTGTTVAMDHAGYGKTLAEQRLIYAEKAKIWDNVISSTPLLIYNYDLVGERFVSALTGIDRDLTAEELEAYPNAEDPVRHQSLRHPRTLYALTADNHLLLVVIAGRFAGYAEGMNAKECTRFLKKHFNPQYAINMDGGGSSTMSVHGNVVNYPSGNGVLDHTGERKLAAHLFITDSQSE